MSFPLYRLLRFHFPHELLQVSWASFKLLRGLMNSWTCLWVDSSLANLQGPAVTILNQKAKFLMVDSQLTAKCTLMNFNCCLVRSLEFDVPFHYVYFPYCNWEHGRTWLELRIRCEHNFGIVVIFMHALCYFFLSLQLIQAVLSTSFHQLGPGKKDTKKVVAKLFLFLFIIIYFTKLKSIKNIYGKNAEI